MCMAERVNGLSAVAGGARATSADGWHGSPPTVKLRNRRRVVKASVTKWASRDQPAGVVPAIAAATRSACLDQAAPGDPPPMSPYEAATRGAIKSLYRLGRKRGRPA